MPSVCIEVLDNDMWQSSLDSHAMSLLREFIAAPAVAPALRRRHKGRRSAGGDCCVSAKGTNGTERQRAKGTHQRVPKARNPRGVRGHAKFLKKGP